MFVASPVQADEKDVSFQNVNTIEFRTYHLPESNSYLKVTLVAAP